MNCIDLNIQKNQNRLNLEVTKEISVLIINDEPFISQMIAEQLKKLNIMSIQTALNGFDGYNMVV